MGHQGFTNWETWHTKLLIDNERDLHDIKNELVKRKASVGEFRTKLRRAETETRKLHNANAKSLPKSEWNTKFEKVNWSEIRRETFEEF